MDHEIYGKGQSNWGFAQETTFGTALTDAENYIMLEGPIPTGINYGVTEHEMVKHGGGRVLEEEQFYATQDGGLIEIPFSDVVVRQNDLAELLYAVCQDVTEDAATPYGKTFGIDNDWDQPNFSNNGTMPQITAAKIAHINAFMVISFLC